jgi:aldose 1-epimerase
MITSSNCLDDPPIVRHAVTLTDEESGRQLIVHTSQPGVQIYTANWLQNESHNISPIVQHNGICLETEHFPDSINQKHFPSTLLRPDEIYRHRTIYSFQVVN